MKQVPILLSLLLFSGFLSACDSLGGYSSKEIPVKQNVYFRGLEFTVTDATTRQNDTEFKFTANQRFIVSMDNVLSDLMSNISGGDVRSIDLGQISLTCTTSGLGSMVKELKLSAVGNNNETWELPALDCRFGVPVQHAALNSFVQKVIYYNLYGKSVVVTATGWTDAPVGTQVDIEITAYLNRLKVKIYTGV